MTTIAVTGHRLDKLGGYTLPIEQRLVAFAEQQLQALAVRHSFDRVLTGMALGWDQAVAHACYRLRLSYVACLPCDGQERLWPLVCREHWEWLLDKAADVAVVSPGPYEAWKMQRRNEYMVDRASRAVLALRDGSAGGTASVW